MYSVAGAVPDYKYTARLWTCRITLSPSGDICGQMPKNIYIYIPITSPHGWWGGCGGWGVQRFATLNHQSIAHRTCIAIASSLHWYFYRYHITITLEPHRYVSHRYRIGITSVLHQYQGNITPISTSQRNKFLSHYYIGFPLVSHRYHNNIASLSHQTISQRFTSVSHQYHISITSVSKQYHININITTISYRYHASITSVSHQYHIGITSISHTYYISITQISPRYRNAITSVSR